MIPEADISIIENIFFPANLKKTWYRLSRFPKTGGKPEKIIFTSVKSFNTPEYSFAFRKPFFSLFLYDDLEITLHIQRTGQTCSSGKAFGLSECKLECPPYPPMERPATKLSSRLADSGKKDLAILSTSSLIKVQ